MQSRGNVRGVGGGQHQRGTGHGVGDRTGAPGDHGHPGHHRLDERHAEPLVGGQREVHVGGLEVGSQRRVGDLARQADRGRQAEVVHEVPQGLGVLEARRATHQVQAGLPVVEPAVGPQRLDQLVLGLGGHDPPDEEDVGAAARPEPGQFRRHPGVRGPGDPPVVRQDGNDRGVPAPRPAELLLAEGALGQPEQRPGGQQRQLVRRRLRPPHALRLPAGEVLRSREVVEVQNEGHPTLGQVARHGRGRRELVDSHVARCGMLGVHPMLEGL